MIVTGDMQIYVQVLPTRFGCQISTLTRWNNRKCTNKQYFKAINLRQPTIFVRPASLRWQNEERLLLSYYFFLQSVLKSALRNWVKEKRLFFYFFQRLYNSSLVRYETRMNYDVGCAMDFRRFPLDNQVHLMLIIFIMDTWETDIAPKIQNLWTGVPDKVWIIFVHRRPDEANLDGPKPISGIFDGKDWDANAKFFQG